MGQLASVIAPVFALIALGHGTARRRFMDHAALRGLNDFVYWLAIPALLFKAVAEAGHLDVLDVAGAYFAACLAVYAVAMLLARALLGAGLARAGMFGLNATFGNTVMMGIPVVSAAYGPRAVPYLLAIIAFHSALLLPLATILIEAGTPREGAHGAGDVIRSTAQGMVRNPVIMSIVLAFVWRVAGIPVPDALDRLLGLIGACAPALALFCLGASLPPPGRQTDWWEPALASLLKLLLLPAAVMLIAGYLLGLGGMPLKVAIMTAAMPTGANAFLLARRMATLTETSATTVVLGTAISLLTLSALLVLL
jgi:malonate transporter